VGVGVLRGGLRGVTICVSVPVGVDQARKKKERGEGGSVADVSSHGGELIEGICWQGGAPGRLAGFILQKKAKRVHAFQSGKRKDRD